MKGTDPASGPFRFPRLGRQAQAIGGDLEDLFGGPKGQGQPPAALLRARRVTWTSRWRPRSTTDGLGKAGVVSRSSPPGTPEQQVAFAAGKAIGWFGLEGILYGFPRERTGFLQCRQERNRMLQGDGQAAFRNHNGPSGIWK